jgi:hypothetical protein
VAWFNGTALFEGNTFFERPTDMSSYNRVVVRLAATNIEGGNVPSVELEYFLLTGNFEYQAAGLIEVLPADGQFHAITFPIDAIADRRYVQGHGINLQEHDGGTLIIDVDSIRALGPGNEETDCNGNSVPDTCDIASGLEQDLNQNGKPDSCEEEPGVAFKRGDCNLDGNANITDGIFLLNFLFLGGTRPGCMAACDNNGSGQLNITNAVYIFNFLFLGGPDPPPPHPDCGPPRPQDATLGCNASSQGCA